MCLAIRPDEVVVALSLSGLHSRLHAAKRAAIKGRSLSISIRLDLSNRPCVQTYVAQNLIRSRLSRLKTRSLTRLLELINNLVLSHGACTYLAHYIVVLLPSDLLQERRSNVVLLHRVDEVLVRHHRISKDLVQLLKAQLIRGDVGSDLVV